MQNVNRLIWAAEFVVRVYGVSIRIRSNRPELLNRVWRHLPHGCEVVESPAVDRVYSIAIGGAGDKPSPRRYSLLYSDRVQLFRSLDVDAVFDRLETSLRLLVAELAHDRVFVHAGVVAWK